MVVHEKKPRENEERTAQFKGAVIRGINQYDVGSTKIPLVGHLLKGARDFMSRKLPMAQGISAKDLKQLYDTITGKHLASYGRFAISDELFRTEHGDLEGRTLIDGSIERDDPLLVGSYLKFQDLDRTLHGSLYVGDANDRKLVTENGQSPDVMDYAQMALGKAKETSLSDVAGAVGDYVAVRGGMMLVPVLAIPGAILAAGGAANFARKAYNAARADSHWELVLEPFDRKITADQFNTLRDLIQTYTGE